MSVSTSAATAAIKRSKWKFTTASAFTSARANHAKTARRQDIEVHRLDRLSPFRFLIFLRFEFGELLFGPSDIGFTGAADGEKLLLPMEVCLGHIELGALPFRRGGLGGLS